MDPPVQTQDQGQDAQAQAVQQAQADAQAKDAALQDANRQAASYRVQRNAALREAHALRTIAKAHQIDISGVTPEALATLPIEEGKVDGVFQYTPPKLTTLPNTTKTETTRLGAEGSVTLTRESIEAMDSAEINKRWDEVKAFLEKGKK